MRIFKTTKRFSNIIIEWINEHKLLIEVNKSVIFIGMPSSVKLLQNEKIVFPNDVHQYNIEFICMACHDAFHRFYT